MWFRGIVLNSVDHMTDHMTVCQPFSCSSSSSFVYHQMTNSVSCSHALVSGPRSKRPASEGGLYKGQPVIMCSAVCSISPHSHAELLDKPHFLIHDLKRPTPQRRRFRDVHWWRGRSSPFTPPAGSRIYRCMRQGSAVSHDVFKAVANLASLDKSLGMD